VNTGGDQFTERRAEPILQPAAGSSRQWLGSVYVAAANPLNSLADSFTRLIRLETATHRDTKRREALLMDLSRERLQVVSREGSTEHQLVVGRVFETPQDFCRWEADHARIMRSVARLNRQGLRVRAMISASCALVHRKALFEYLRDNTIRGSQRRQLVGHFHREDYSHALVNEHGNYVRSFASLLCARYLGEVHFRQAGFERAALVYERTYRDYFRAYCESLVGESEVVDESGVRALLPMLKQQVMSTRAAWLKPASK
jgi:hypothetical protein